MSKININEIDASATKGSGDSAAEAAASSSVPRRIIRKITPLHIKKLHEAGLARKLAAEVNKNKAAQIKSVNVVTNVQIISAAAAAAAPKPTQQLTQNTDINAVTSTPAANLTTASKTTKSEKLETTTTASVIKNIIPPKITITKAPDVELSNDSNPQLIQQRKLQNHQQREQMSPEDRLAHAKSILNKKLLMKAENKRITTHPQNAISVQQPKSAAAVISKAPTSTVTRQEQSYSTITSRNVECTKSRATLVLPQQKTYAHLRPASTELTVKPPFKKKSPTVPEQITRALDFDTPTAASSSAASGITEVAKQPPVVLNYSLSSRATSILNRRDNEIVLKTKKQRTTKAATITVAEAKTTLARIKRQETATNSQSFDDYYPNNAQARVDNDYIPKASIKSKHNDYIIAAKKVTVSAGSSASSNISAVQQIPSSFPVVSPLKKQPFPLTTCPQSTPLPAMSTFKAPFNPIMPLPLLIKEENYDNATTRSEQQNYHDYSTVHSSTNQPVKSLIVLEDKVLSQDEKIDLNALRFSAPQMENLRVPATAVFAATTPTITNQFPTIQQTQQIQNHQLLNSNITTIIGQPKKTIQAPDKLKLPLEKIAALAKRIKSQATQTQLKKRSTTVLQCQITPLTTEKTMDATNSASTSACINIPAEVATQPYLMKPSSAGDDELVKFVTMREAKNQFEAEALKLNKLKSQPLTVKETGGSGKIMEQKTMASSSIQQLSNTVTQSHISVAIETNDSSTIAELPIAADTIQTHSTFSSKLTSVQHNPAIPIIYSNLAPPSSSTATTSNLHNESAVEIFDNPLQDNSSISAVDFIASLTTENPITEETTLELSPEELNLNASFAMDFSPLRIPVLTFKDRRSLKNNERTTSVSSKPDASTLLADIFMPNVDLEIGNIVTIGNVVKTESAVDILENGISTVTSALNTVESLNTSGNLIIQDNSNRLEQAMKNMMPVVIKPVTAAAIPAQPETDFGTKICPAEETEVFDKTTPKVTLTEEKIKESVEVEKSPCIVAKNQEINLAEDTSNIEEDNIPWKNSILENIEDNLDSSLAIQEQTQLQSSMEQNVYEDHTQIPNVTSESETNVETNTESDKHISELSSLERATTVTSSDAATASTKRISRFKKGKINLVQRKKSIVGPIVAKYTKQEAAEIIQVEDMKNSNNESCKQEVKLGVSAEEEEPPSQTSPHTTEEKKEPVSIVTKSYEESAVNFTDLPIADVANTANRTHQLSATSVEVEQSTAGTFSQTNNNPEIILDDIIEQVAEREGDKSESHPILNVNSHVDICDGVDDIENSQKADISSIENTLNTDGGTRQVIESEKDHLRAEASEDVGVENETALPEVSHEGLHQDVVPLLNSPKVLKRKRTLKSDMPESQKDVRDNEEKETNFTSLFEQLKTVEEQTQIIPAKNPFKCQNIEKKIFGDVEVIKTLLQHIDKAQLVEPKSDEVLDQNATANEKTLDEDAALQIQKNNTRQSVKSTSELNEQKNQRKTSVKKEVVMLENTKADKNIENRLESNKTQIIAEMKANTRDETSSVNAINEKDHLSTTTSQSMRDYGIKNEPFHNAQHNKRSKKISKTIELEEFRELSPIKRSSKKSKLNPSMMQSDLESTDASHVSNKNTCDDETAKEESSQELPQPKSRKRLRKTLDDLNKRRVASYTDSDTDNEAFDYCEGSNDFLGFDETSLHGSKKRNANEMVKSTSAVEEVCNPNTSVTSCLNECPQMMDTILPPIAKKMRSSLRSNVRSSIPLKKRWELKARSSEDIEITDDTSPAPDEDNYAMLHATLAKRQLDEVDPKADIICAKKFKLSKVVEKREMSAPNILMNTQNDGALKQVGDLIQISSEGEISKSQQEISKAKTRLNTQKKSTAAVVAAISVPNISQNEKCEIRTAKTKLRKSKKPADNEANKVSQPTASISTRKTRKSIIEYFENHNAPVKPISEAGHTIATKNKVVPAETENRRSNRRKRNTSVEMVDETNSEIIQSNEADIGLNNELPTRDKKKRGRKKVNKNLNNSEENNAKYCDIEIKLEETCIVPQELPIQIKKKPGRKRKSDSTAHLETEPTNTSVTAQSTTEPIVAAAVVKSGRRGRKSASTTAEDFNSRLLLIRKREQLETDEVLTATKATAGAGPIQCGFCLARTNQAKWTQHLAEHYGVGWIAGQPEINVNSRNVVLNTIINFIKDTKSKGISCRLCANSYRSALGLLLHLENCGAQQVRVICEHCQREFSKSSMPYHMRTCPALQHADDEEEVPTLSVINEAVEEVFNNCGRRKRASLMKAENKLKSFGEESVGNDFDADGSECEINTGDDQSSDDDDDVSSGVDSNAEENQIQTEESDYDRERKAAPSKRNRNKSTIAQQALYCKVYPSRARDLTTVVKRKWNQFIANNYANTTTLYDYAAPQYKLCNNSHYVKCWPQENISMKFALSQKRFAAGLNNNTEQIEWSELQRFESAHTKNDHYIFLGAPIRCLAWVPLTADVKEQYLVVAYRKNTQKFTSLANPKLSKTLLIVYKISRAADSTLQMQLHYAISIPKGPVHCLNFLPSGGYDAKLNRLGLLAIGTAINQINIYALPINVSDDESEMCKQQAETISSIENIKIVSLTPAFVLTLDVNNATNENAHSLLDTQCLQICWSEFKGHKYIFAGFSNGCIGIWNITEDTSENLNSFLVDGLQQNVPLNYFYVGEKCIQSLALHYDTNGPRWLAAICYARKMIVYDIRNLCQPVAMKEEYAKGLVRSLAWPIVWEPVIMGYCDMMDTTPGVSSLIAVNPLGLVYQNSKVDNALTAVTQLNYNPATNIQTAATDNGDIIFYNTRELHLDEILPPHNQYKNAKALAMMSVKQLNGAEVTKYKNYDVPDDWEMFENDYKEKYGLVFGPVRDYSPKHAKDYVSEKRIPSINVVRYMRINSLCCNLNANAVKYVAVGYENGFLRLINFNRNDYFD